MQAQAWYNQPQPGLQPVLLPTPPFLEGGVSVSGFSEGALAGAASATGAAGGSAGAAGAVSAGASGTCRNIMHGIIPKSLYKHGIYHVYTLAWILKFNILEFICILML